MKVKFNTSIVLVNGLSFALNQVAEVEDAIVAPFIEAGIAEEVNDVVPTGTKIVGNIPVEFQPANKKQPAKAKPKKTEIAE